jgi:hypothetical protein
MKQDTMDKEEIISEFRELDELLSEFDATISGFNPGVMGYVGKDWKWHLHLDIPTWAWLKPLLQELKERRHES